jgi:hypothetical protein
MTEYGALRNCITSDFLTETHPKEDFLVNSSCIPFPIAKETCVLLKLRFCLEARGSRGRQGGWEAWEI